jgi:hypothetical protein
MKKLLPLFAILFFLAAGMTATGLPAPSELNSISRTYFQPGQDQLVRDIELYPNPITDGHLTITSTESIQTVQILNITGKIVFNQEFQPNTNTVDLELDKLEKGIYLVRIGFLGKETHTEKVMVK